MVTYRAKFQLLAFVLKEKIKMVVYQIRNNITGKSYIGQTKDLNNRISAHLYNLRRNNHPNKDLQDDYNLHGESSFSFFPIVEELEPIDADIIEECMISAFYGPAIYNISKNAHGGDNISYHPDNLAIRQKIGEASKKVFEDPEKIEQARNRMLGENNPMYGKHHTEETRQKMSANSGIRKKVFTEEDRQRMSEQMNARYAAHPEIRNKVSEGLKRAYENNDGLRAKISQASKEHWQNEKYRKAVLEGLHNASMKRARKIHVNGKDYNTVAEVCNDFGVTIGTIMDRCKSPNYPEWYYVN